jgi:MFS family permease
VLTATILGSGMVFVDGSAVNVALPALQRDLNATIAEAQWIIESYALFLAALLLAAGAAGDRYGRRRIFIFGTTIFALASVWCGLAGTALELIIARGLQGIGGALLVPNSLAIISASFDKAERGKAIGTWSGATAITAAIGPVLGGWLIDEVSWRAVFFLNVPLAVAVLAIAQWHVPESRNVRNDGPPDWAGATLATIVLGGLVNGLIEPRNAAGRTLAFSRRLSLASQRSRSSFASKNARVIPCCRSGCSARAPLPARTYLLSFSMQLSAAASSSCP